MTYSKKVAVMIFGIILIVAGAFIMASLVREKNLEIVEKNEGVKVGDEAISFKLYRVDQSFFIQIPDAFSILDEQTLKDRYGLSDRPELVFQSPDDISHVFVNTTDYQVNDVGLVNYVDALKSGLSGLTIQSYEVNNRYGKPFVRLIAVDNNSLLYRNIVYFTYQDRLVIVEFNTSIDLQENWQKASNFIIDSICFDEKDVKKEIE